MSKNIISFSLFFIVCAMSSASLAMASDHSKFDYFHWGAKVDVPEYVQEFKRKNPESLFISLRSEDEKALFILKSREIWLVEDGEDRKDGIEVSTVPDSIDISSAHYFDNKIYFGPSNLDTVIHSFDILEGIWGKIENAPTLEVGQPVISNIGNFLLLFTKDVAYKYNFKNKEWKQFSPPKESLGGMPSVVIGDNHLLFVNPKEPSRGAVYYIIPDKWYSVQLDFSEFHGDISDNNVSVVVDDGILIGKSTLPSRSLHPLDYIVILIAFIIILGVGILSSSKNSSSDEYFRAGRTVPWWAAALSIFATSASAITMMSMPAMAFYGDWSYLTIAIYMVLIQVPLFVYFYVPLIRKLNLSSANEYLERRFGVGIRTLGFISFSLNQIFGRMAAILLLPAIALNSLFGFPLNSSIAIIGVATTIFVTVGGFRAVIWTDVVLALIMIVAVVLCLGFALNGIELSYSEAKSTLLELDKLHMFEFSSDIAAPLAVFLFINSLFTSLSFIGDQNFVQRVQATSSLAASKRASVAQVLVGAPLNFLLFVLGTLIFLYITTRPEVISPQMKPDGIYPFFAAITLPAGGVGIVIMALLAATISTVSSALNSVSNLCIEDVFKRYKPDVSQTGIVVIARVLTILLGLLGTFIALLLANNDSLISVWNLFLAITGMIISPIAGAFILGVFTRRANTKGAWVGVFSALFANIITYNYVEIHPTAFLIIGVLVCVVMGYLASVFRSNGEQCVRELTVYDKSNVNP